ncbi:I78 family peptidase inhibitor [Novosphingobium album (ex Liu et al. 2023)]|uniref:I78 family peptidase inhibitor n=1 Tax=Novosphingobium album (ex Liu et al. 2023) TaxID=3031130 RepID=A0ABT5WUT1_9SPHN|nr:I78 family peptidase inhibitor [Novosphingobium album (ex Liu et al. 2023)]MDE8653665.1 I78 family peptidase inhibitor [Novosphingobium album (ex Liu et al. 2023)]
MIRVLTPLTALAALSLAGCTTPSVPSDSGQVSFDPDACGASQLGAYLGVIARGPAIERIRAWAGKKTVRLTGPGDIVTLELQPDRINVETDGKGVITRIHCG